MAYMHSDGLDDINKMMNDLGLIWDDDTIHEALKAGGELSRQAWISQIESRTDAHTGDLAGSVKTGKIAKSRDGTYIIIYPQGKRGDGKRNATVAFILNYSSRYPRQNGFVEMADAEAEPRIVARMKQIIEEKIKKIGGN